MCVALLPEDRDGALEARAKERERELTWLSEKARVTWGEGFAAKCKRGMKGNFITRQLSEAAPYPSISSSALPEATSPSLSPFLPQALSSCRSLFPFPIDFSLFLLHLLFFFSLSSISFYVYTHTYTSLYIWNILAVVYIAVVSNNLKNTAMYSTNIIFFYVSTVTILKRYMFYLYHTFIWMLFICNIHVNDARTLFFRCR